MRILFIGDIIGRPGKHACSQIVPRLIREQGVDCVVANAENTAAGSGMTPQMFDKLLRFGVDCCTMGDHIYKRRELIPSLLSSDRIVRPANYPPESAGRELAVVPTRDGGSLAVLSLMGRTFMNVRADCPFHAADRVLDRVPADVTAILVDMHAEATSEKIAMGWHLDGRVTAVLGTHTHIPTADARVLPGGTAYITDVGMTGPYDSVLGRDKRRVLRALITGMPEPYDVASEDTRLSGVMIDTEPTSRRALSIRHVWERDEPEPMPDDVNPSPAAAEATQPVPRS